MNSNYEKNMMRSIIFILFIFMVLFTHEAEASATFGIVSSDQTQIPGLSGLTSSIVHFEMTEFSNPFLTIENNTTIRVSLDGSYTILVNGHAGATGPGVPGHVELWLKKNGVAIPNSSVFQAVDNTMMRYTLFTQTTVSIARNDTITLWLGPENSTLGIVAVDSSNSNSIAPSVSLSITKSLK